jgi:hypothetical protein
MVFIEDNGISWDLKYFHYFRYLLEIAAISWLLKISAIVTAVVMAAIKFEILENTFDNNLNNSLNNSEN